MKLATKSLKFPDPRENVPKSGTTIDAIKRIKGVLFEKESHAVL